MEAVIRHLSRVIKAHWLNKPRRSQFGWKIAKKKRQTDKAWRYTPQ
jgi:hypothetical protein